MTVVSIDFAAVEHFRARVSSMNALNAHVRPASSRVKYEQGSEKGLLSRMYPGLSHEQAVAVVRQEIMVEHLRKVAKSQSRTP